MQLLTPPSQGAYTSVSWRSGWRCDFLSFLLFLLILVRAPGCLKEFTVFVLWHDVLWVGLEFRDNLEPRVKCFWRTKKTNTLKNFNVLVFNVDFNRQFYWHLLTDAAVGSKYVNGFKKNNSTISQKNVGKCWISSWRDWPFFFRDTLRWRISMATTNTTRWLSCAKMSLTVSSFFSFLLLYNFAVSFLI